MLRTLIFPHFPSLLRADDVSDLFCGRSRRPPKDPVNATLSFFYTMLSRDITSACESVGLDPQMGFLHACRPGRESLALDVIEELRAFYVDRFVLTLFNRGQLDREDFRFEAGGAVFFREHSIKRGSFRVAKKEAGECDASFFTGADSVWIAAVCAGSASCTVPSWRLERLSCLFVEVRGVRIGYL